MKGAGLLWDWSADRCWSEPAAGEVFYQAAVEAEGVEVFPARRKTASGVCAKWSAWMVPRYSPQRAELIDTMPSFGPSTGVKIFHARAKQD